MVRRKSHIMRGVHCAARYIERIRVGLVNYRIARILRDPRPPVLPPAVETYELLQNRYSMSRTYAYGTFPNWERSVHRSLRMFRDLEGLKSSSQRILELGCGDGMLGVVLGSYGHAIVLADARDWREPRARSIAFRKVDACDALPFDDSSFDLICSFNTFEHLADPRLALEEMLRTSRDGGHIYMDFGPLYASAWGLHARSLRMPYPQFLFSEDFIGRKIKELKNTDLGEEQATLQHVNRWRLSDFRRLWSREECFVVREQTRSRREYLGLISEYPQAFRGRGLTVADVATQAMNIVLRRKV